MRLSELLGQEVVTTSGRRLGKVHDALLIQDGPIASETGAYFRLHALAVGQRSVGTPPRLHPRPRRGTPPAQMAVRIRVGPRPLDRDRHPRRTLHSRVRRTRTRSGLTTEHIGRFFRQEPPGALDPRTLTAFGDSQRFEFRQSLRTRSDSRALATARCMNRHPTNQAHRAPVPKAARREGR